MLVNSYSVLIDYHGRSGVAQTARARANPLLSKEGQARSAGVVCSKTRSYLIDAREALLINRYCSSLNRPPQPSLREGIPALLRRGMALLSWTFLLIGRAYNRANPWRAYEYFHAIHQEACRYHAIPVRDHTGRRNRVYPVAGFCLTG